MDADAAALDAVEPYEKSAPVKALAWYSELGDQPQLRALSGGLLALGLLRGDGRMARAGARMLAAQLLATFAKNFVKRRVDRTRPRSAERQGRAQDEAGAEQGQGGDQLPLGPQRRRGRGRPRLRPRISRTSGGRRWAAAGMIALAQIPRCAHYPTDVGAGLAIGLAAEAAVNAAWPD